MTDAAAQENKRSAEAKDAADRALAWFKQIKDESFSDSLRRFFQLSVN